LDVWYPKLQPTILIDTEQQVLLSHCPFHGVDREYGDGSDIFRQSGGRIDVHFGFFGWVLDVNLDDVKGGGNSNQICENVIVWGDEEEVRECLRDRENDWVGDVLYVNG
jgi:hypothetical protein